MPDEGTTIRGLLAELDRVSEPDWNRCPICGTKVHRVKTDRDSWFADESGDGKCHWESRGGNYGYQHWHGSGWTDEDAIEAAKDAVIAAVRKRGPIVLDALVAPDAG